MHDFNPSTLETEAGIFLNSRPVWSIEKVIEQPRLFIEQGYSGKQNIKQNKINNNKKKHSPIGLIYPQMSHHMLIRTENS